MEENVTKNEVQCDEVKVTTEGSRINEKCDIKLDGNESLNELSQSEGSIREILYKKQEVNEASNKISKRQLKRQKKKEKWLAKLPEKRAREKERLKLRRSEAREKNIKLGPTRKELKRCKMSTSKCKIKVVLDFSFDHLMIPKDISKCVNQAMRCYSLNRRSKNPMQFYIVNFKGKSLEEMRKHNGFHKWDVHFHQEDYLELFKKESLVYLTSDSDNVIETLEEDKVYIIGALVDHNSHKGLCHKIAKQQGIQHGHLPIGEHLDLKTRKVLAVNHVFEIMLHYCDGLSWKDAFIKVLPPRKGAIEKTSDTDSDLKEKTVDTDSDLKEKIIETESNLKELNEEGR